MPPEKPAEVNEDAIEFSVPGLPTDTRLHIFGVEFQVSSVVLKTQSRFFREKWDASVENYEGSSSEFQSEWFTKATEIGWILTDKEQYRFYNNDRFTGIPYQQQACFDKFLCALFGRPFEIKSIGELSILTGLASYYGGLRAVSNALYSALHNSPDIITIIKQDPCTVLRLAKYLRNTLLFKESLILCLGPWSNPVGLQLTDPDLITRFDKQRAVLRTMVANTKKSIDTLMANTADFADHIPKPSLVPTTLAELESEFANPSSASAAESRSSDHRYAPLGPFQMPWPLYFRMCSTIAMDPGLALEIRKVTARMLVSHLRLDPTAIAGQPPGVMTTPTAQSSLKEKKEALKLESNATAFRDYFLCMDLDDDEKVPWDTAEVEF